MGLLTYENLSKFGDFSGGSWTEKNFIGFIGKENYRILASEEDFFIVYRKYVDEYEFRYRLTPEEKAEHKTTNCLGLTIPNDETSIALLNRLLEYIESLPDES